MAFYHPGRFDANDNTEERSEARERVGKLFREYLESEGYEHVRDFADEHYANLGFEKPLGAKNSNTARQYFMKISLGERPIRHARIGHGLPFTDTEISRLVKLLEIMKIPNGHEDIEFLKKVEPRLNERLQ